MLQSQSQQLQREQRNYLLLVKPYDLNYNSHQNNQNQSLMQYSYQEKRLSQYSNMAKAKLIQNKPHHNYNYQKQYQDEQNTLALKGSDSSQVRDLKGKIKLVMTKLTSVKKEKEELQKQNKTLQEQVTSLQTNLRQMVSGFSNTSSSFPTYNEIGSKFAQFYKYECLDLFFDVLCPQMNVKGVISFYFYSFEKIEELIKQYFNPCFHSIQQVGCFDSIDGPIMNVLRKAFQTTYIQILSTFESKGKIEEAFTFVRSKMMMDDMSEDIKDRIKDFLKKLLQLKLCCMISDPPFEINTKQIGQKVHFNPLNHDPFDGFIKPKEDCWVVLPSVRKSNEDKETVTKSLVLQVNYDETN